MSLFTFGSGRGSAFHGFALTAQVLAADTVASAPVGPGFTESALIRIADAIAGATACFRLTHSAQILTTDAVASAPVGLGLAVTTLVRIIDPVATATSGFRLTHPAQILIVDTVATAATGLGFAISALILIVDAHTASKGMAGEGKHQQHRKYFLHHTLPWLTSKQTGTG
ncbi:hypothetical protein ACW9HX_00035 [Pseudomonas sp. SDO52101_S400]